MVDQPIRPLAVCHRPGDAMSSNVDPVDHDRSVALVVDRPGLPARLGPGREVDPADLTGLGVVVEKRSKAGNRGELKKVEQEIIVANNRLATLKQQLQK